MCSDMTNAALCAQAKYFETTAVIALYGIRSDRFLMSFLMFYHGLFLVNIDDVLNCVCIWKQYNMNAL